MTRESTENVREIRGSATGYILILSPRKVTMMNINLYKPMLVYW